MNAMTDKAAKKIDEARKTASKAVDSGKAKASDAMKSAKDKSSAAVKNARSKADDAARVAREKTDDAIKAARAKASEAAQASRDSARRAADKTSQGIEANPVVALLGGLAIGAIAAALIPRTTQEAKAMGKAGKAIRSTAQGALAAAKQAGLDQLDVLGVNADAAKDQVRDLARKIGEAASSAGTAAADAVRQKR